MKDKKRLVLRILKEIGRLALIVFVPLLLPILFAIICNYNRVCHTELYICVSTCINYARIVFLANLILLGIILFIYIRRKKLSKLWLIEGIVFFSFLSITGKVIDYVTKQESPVSAIEIENTLEQQYKTNSEGLK